MVRKTQAEYMALTPAELRLLGEASAKLLFAAKAKTHQMSRYVLEEVEDAVRRVLRRQMWSIIK